MVKISHKQGEYFIEVETGSGTIVIRDIKVEVQMPMIDMSEGEEYYELNLLRKSFYHLTLLKEHLKFLNEKINEAEEKCSI